jgi:H/ACA ribonucleoprotein complex subunit 3
MRRCQSCDKYTLKKDECPYCKGVVRIPHPAKFSPDDKYAKYKGMMRQLKE